MFEAAKKRVFFNSTNHISMDQLMTIGGWTKPVQLMYLIQQVKALPEESVIVEIGIWQGRSAIAMADACRGTNKKVFAIDPWQDYETKHGLLSSRLVEFNVDSIESVYVKFMDNRRKYKVEPWLEAIRLSSTDAALKWSNGKCAMVFIDGNHSYLAVLNDLRTWSNLTLPGGLVCGDDWLIESVRQGVSEFITKEAAGQIELPCENTWAFRK